MTIDLTIGDGERSLGICKLAGDALTICVGNQKGRPVDFEQKALPWRAVLEFSREQQQARRTLKALTSRERSARNYGQI